MEAKRMSQYPPRDYPASSHTTLAGSEDVDSVTLCSVKERLEAQQPVSHEMIHQAVTNLFSIDSHDVFHRPADETLRTPLPMRHWLKVKKPS